MNEILPLEKPRALCPYCGFEMRVFPTVDQTRQFPEPGDFAVCTECLEVSIFRRERLAMTLRVATSREMYRLYQSGGMKDVNRVRAKILVSREARARAEREAGHDSKMRAVWEFFRRKVSRLWAH